MLARLGTDSTVLEVSSPQLSRGPLGGNLGIMTKSIILTIYLVFIFVGCNPIPDEPKRNQDEEKLVETVLSHFFSNGKGNFFVCQSVGDSTVSLNQDLVNRLQAKYAKPSLGIHSMDDAELRDTRTSPDQINAEHYVDKQTGKLGESLTVGNVTWIDGNNVELRISTWFDPLLGGSTKYRLSRNKFLFLFDRGWKVDAADMDTRF